MILLAGAGSIGKRHLANLVRCGKREFLVLDPRQDRRAEARTRAEEAFVSAGSSQGPLKISEAATLEVAAGQSRSLEAIVIATPPLYHPPVIRFGVENRLPLFCEKPLAGVDKEWDALRGLAAQAAELSLLSMVAYNYRFCSQLQAVRKMVADGEVGTVYSVRGTFSENLREWHPWEGLNFYMASRAQGGGALLDESHLIDLCRWIFGEIREAAGYNTALSSLKQEPGFDADDLVEILVRFESGAIGSLHMDLFGKYHQKRLEIIGEEATLIWNFDNTDIESNGIQLWKGRRLQIDPERTRRMPESLIPSDGRVRNEMYLDETRYFLQCIERGGHLRDDVPDLEDGLQTLSVLRAVHRSAGSGKLETVENMLQVPTDER